MNSTKYDDFFEGRRVLVTGGAGFIGSHLTQHLTMLGAQVSVLDDFSSGNRANLEGLDVDINEGSILDRTAIEHGIRDCSVVFHKAAFVSVPDSFENAKRCFEVNVDGTNNVLQAATTEKCHRVVFASSAACYGSDPELPSKESDDISAESPYAQSKEMGEQLMRDADVDGVSLRYFNVFGVRQDPHSQYAAVISAFTDAIKNHRKPIIFGNGMQARDFTHVDNIVHANLLAASHLTPLRGDVFNVGTGVMLTLLEVLQAMVGQGTVDVNFQPPRIGDVMKSCADITKIVEVLHYVPAENTEHCLRSIVNPIRH
jgi:nucleoside-diphosphate-sugar epimerase